MVSFLSSRLIFLKFQVLKYILAVLTSMDFHEISHKCSADEYLSSKGHIFSSELYLDAIFSKKLPFFVKKSASNFFGPQLGKTKLIFLFYTFFRTSMQKIGDGYFFFFSKLLKLSFWSSGYLTVLWEGTEISEHKLRKCLQRGRLTIL